MLCLTTLRTAVRKTLQVSELGLFDTATMSDASNTKHFSPIITPGGRHFSATS